MARIEQVFSNKKQAGGKVFIAYIMAGDDSYEKSLQVMQGLPAAGVDIIELGLPFTDPMADGATIQLAGQRALEAGQTLERTFDMVREFRKTNTETPIVLMGYFNPIYARGIENFLREAKEVGIDGLIVVDLPPEEDDELCVPAQQAGLNFIRLATPTSDEQRLAKVLTHVSGFVYYVSMTGVTGSAAAQFDAVAPEIKRIKQMTSLPVAVGFGIKSPALAAAFTKVADGVVVGSAIVERIGRGESPAEVLDFVAKLASAVHNPEGVTS